MRPSKPGVSRFRSTGGLGRTGTVSGRVGPDRSASLMDGLVLHTIDSLQDMGEDYTRRIEVERRRSGDLEKKLRTLKVKLEETRKIAAGLDDVTVKRRMTAQLRSVENKLQKMVVKENEQETETKAYRTRIESLRRERMQHIRIRKQLEREIRAQKKVLMEYMHDTREAAERRDKSQREVQVLQTMLQQEVADFEDEFKERVAELQAERPMTLREIERTTKTGPEEASRLLVETSYVGSMTLDQETALKHRSVKSFWDIAKREVDLGRQTKLLTKYDDAFQKIRRETGIQTIDEMTAEFVSAEERNFSLINMINDLNREIEALEVENAEVRSKVQAAKDKGTSSEASRRAIFEGLEAQIAAADRKAELFNRNYDQTLRSMDGLKSHIVTIFQKVGCSDEGTAERLLATGVTENSIMTFLGLIEQRVSEICQMVEMSKAGHPLTYTDPGGGDASLSRSRSDAVGGRVTTSGGAGGAAAREPGIWASTGTLRSNKASTGIVVVGDGGGVAAPRPRGSAAAPLVSLAELDDSESSDDDSTGGGMVRPLSLVQLKSHTNAKLQMHKERLQRRMMTASSHEDSYSSGDEYSDSRLD